MPTGIKLINLQSFQASPLGAFSFPVENDSACVTQKWKSTDTQKLPIENFLLLLLPIQLPLHQPMTLSKLQILLPIRPRNLDRIRDPSIRNPTKSTHRSQNVRINHTPRLLVNNRILPNPKLHPFHNNQHTRLLTGGLPTLEFLRRRRRVQSRFDTEDGFFDAVGFHVRAFRGC